MSEPPAEIVAGRSCAGCTMCCKLMSIAALDKPRLQWCRHCDIGVGCRIYAQRPDECRIFHCSYLLSDELGEHWEPSASKMVVTFAKEQNRVVIYVDPGRPDAWRKPPFYNDIKAWARAAANNRGQVIVCPGRDFIVVLPDGEQNLGPVRDDQLIVTRRKQGPRGIEIDHVIIDHDDPRLEEMKKRSRPR